MLKKSVVLFIVLTAAPVSAQQLVEGIAAVVGKEIILRSEVEQYTNQYLLQNRVDVQKNPELAANIRNQTLNFLIEQKLLLEKAEQDTITVEEEILDQMVEQRIQLYVQKVGTEDDLEKAFGQPLKKIRKEFRKMIREEEMVKQVRAVNFSNVKVSRRDVEQFYKAYNDSLPTLEETVDISHILKLIKPSEEAQQDAYQKILDVKAKIDEGGDFSELAKEYSEDPASATRGGDLGMISRGDFVPEFESAAFSLNNGEISDIVQTTFGFHIIKMIERRGEKIRTQHILIRVIPTGDDEQRIIGELSALRKQILDGADFSELAIKNSDDENVTQDKGRLGTFEVSKMVVPQFKEAILNLSPGEISEPFKTDFGYHIVLLENRSKRRSLSLENDWQKIEEFALNYKMEQEYRKWLEELKKNVPIEIRESI